MAWYDQLDNAAQDGQINEINSQLAVYAAAYQRQEHSKNHLDAIISACEQYISSIPKVERMAFVYGNAEQIKEANNQYPNLEKIIAIQKQAVRRAFLPEAKDDATAMWKLIRGLALSDSKHGVVPGKMLDKLFWSEYAFKGDTAITAWMEGYYRDSGIMSLGEILAKKNMGHTTDVKYFENKDQFKIEFHDGLLYFDGKVLDTRNAKSDVHLLNGQVIYAVDVEGSIYISDPAVEIKHDIHHSSLLQGKRVLCAGTMQVINGEIRLITTDSGHYKPDKNDLLNFLKVLQKNNIDLFNIAVRDQSKDNKNAGRFLITDGNCLSDVEYKAAMTFKSNLLKMKHQLIKYDYMLMSNSMVMDKNEYERVIVPIVAKINAILEKNLEDINHQFVNESRNAIYNILEGAIKNTTNDASGQLVLYDDMKKILLKSNFSTYADNEVFITAVYNGDLQQVQKIIEKGIDVNFILDNITPLSVAVANRDADIVSYLLANGADPNLQNMEGLTPLHFIELIDRQNPLQGEHDEMKGEVDMAIVKDLLAYGANPFIENNAREIPVELVANQELNKLLMDVHDNVEKIIDITENSERAGDLATFLDRCGRIFLPGYFTHRAIDDNSDTILHFAADNGWYDIAKLLIQRGVNPNMRNAQGDTALHLVVIMRDSESNEVRDAKLKIAKMLVEAGVELNQKNAYGKTPLELAEDSDMKAVLSPVKIKKQEQRFGLFTNKVSSNKSQNDLSQLDQKKHGLS